MKNVLRNNKSSFKIFLILSVVAFVLTLYQKFSGVVVQIPASSVPTPQVITGIVAKVIDGDSVILSTDEQVRYIGVDTPEIQTGECYAAEAAKTNSDLVLGKLVKLVKDTSKTDKYGRSLYYVYVGDIFVNDYLLKNGFAKVMTVPPDTKFEDEFVNSENYAKQNLLGIWKNCRNQIKVP